MIGQRRSGHIPVTAIATTTIPRGQLLMTDGANTAAWGLARFTADTFVRANAAPGLTPIGKRTPWLGVGWGIVSNRLQLLRAPLLAELLTNGDFASWSGNPTWWTTVENEPNSGITQVAAAEGRGGVGTGACNFYWASGAAVRLVKNSLLSNAAWYQFDLDVGYAGAGSLVITFSNDGGAGGFTVPTKTYTTSGHKTWRLQNAHGVQLNFQCDTAADITIDNLQLRTFNPFAVVDAGLRDGYFEVGLHIADSTERIGIVVSLDSASTPANYVMVTVLGNSYIYIDKVVAGVGTRLTQVNGYYTQDAALRIIKRGVLYEVWYDGTLITTQTVTDATVINNTLCGVVTDGTANGANYFVAAEQAPEEVAFLGGSITAGNDATAAANRYAWLTSAWLAQNWSQLAVASYVSGLGGSHSWQNLFRAWASGGLLSRNPVLVVLDSAVNDDDLTHDKYAAEAVIRLLLSQPKRPMLLGVFFLRVTDYTGVDTTNVNAATHANWAALLAHYGVQYADYVAEVQRAVAALEHPLSYYFLDDNVHPSDAGHAVAAGLLEAKLTALQPWASTLPAPLWDTAGDYLHEPQSRAGVDYTTLTGTWTTAAGVISSTDAATPATVTYSGTFSGIGINPDDGSTPPNVGLSVDGGAYATVNLNVNGYRIGARAAYTVTIKVLSGTVKIGHFLAL